MSAKPSKVYRNRYCSDGLTEPWHPEPLNLATLDQALADWGNRWACGEGAEFVVQVVEAYEALRDEAMVS